MKRRLSILLALVFLFTAVIGASGVAVYAAENENRIAGDTRYETAAKIAAAKYTSADTVIIVRGDDNEKKEPEVVDGLTASVLAGAKNAPILLTRQNALPDATKEAIEALGAKNAYIIGGTVAVSEDVEKALEDRGVAVKRIEGADRFATAVEVAKEANTGAKTAIVTQGFALVDSLVAGPLAYVKGYPILLVRENEVVEATEKAIKDLGIENIIIVGGEAVVSKDVEKALDELVTGSVKRLGGGDRVETSLLLADELEADEVALVNGWSFVDAVPASVLGLPILYVKQNEIDDDVLAYVGNKAAGFKVIGGKVAVSDDVVNKAKEVVVLKIVEVSAVGAKKLQVVFNKAVDPDKAQFEVKRGTVKPSIKAVTFAEDKKSAVIEFNVAMQSGDYTVTVTGLKDEALTASAKVEAAKLTTIEFTSDVAVISNTNSTQVKVGVVPRNQYGEEYSPFNPNISVSKGSGSWSQNVLTLTYTPPEGSTGGYVVGEKIVVTVADPTTGVVVSKTLTVAQAAQIASIEIGELKTDDAELAAKPVNKTNFNNNITKYYLPVVAKNQYGHVLNASELNVSVDVLTSNSAIIFPDQFVDLSDGTTVLKFKDDPSTDATSGTAVLTLVAKGTGISASKAITVLADAKIDVVYLSAPDAELKKNRSVVLPVTIVDTYGNELALKDVKIDVDTANNKIKLNGDPTTGVVEATIQATNATLSKKVNYVTGAITIEITPTDKNVIITATTSTGKYHSLTLTALDEPVPTSIKGLKSDFVSMLANDASMSTDFAGKVVLLDQYGEEISLSSDYSIVVTKKSGNSTSHTTGTTLVTATATPGNDVYEVALMKDGETNPLDRIEVTISVVDKNKITKFEIGDLGKLYTGGGSQAYNKEIEVYGVVDGKKVKIPQSMVVKMWNNKGLVITEPSGSNVYYTYSAQNTSKETNGNDEIATITAIVEAGDKTYTVTKDVVYSSAAPKAVSLAFVQNDEEVTAVEINITTLQDETPDNIYTGINGLKVVAKDQYNVELKRVSFSITNDETGAMDIDENGVLTVESGATLSGGDSFQINAFIDGLYKAVKVYLK